jgi:hypothetical protein
MNMNNVRKLAACLASVALSAMAIPASAESYCAQFNGTFSNGVKNCPGSGQGGQSPGDPEYVSIGRGSTSAGVKRGSVQLVSSNGGDYIASYIYGIKSNGDFDTSCHAIRSSPGTATDTNCNGSVSFNLYLYAE